VIFAVKFIVGHTVDLTAFLGRGRECFDSEQPQHAVKITRPFYLGTHQVTQGQYGAVMGGNPSEFKGSYDLPVDSVSWLNAVNFCNKLSEREKRTPYYRDYGREVTIIGGNGYRLPTEAEWEYACRAKSTTLYPFGDDARSWARMRGSTATPKTRPILSARSCRTPGACMICWGTSGSGVPIGMTRNITRRRRLLTRRARPMPRTGSSGAVAGTTTSGTVGRRTAAVTCRCPGPTSSGSAWPQSRNDLETEPSSVGRAGGEAEPTPDRAGVRWRSAFPHGLSICPDLGTVSGSRSVSLECRKAGKLAISPGDRQGLPGRSARGRVRQVFNSLPVHSSRSACVPVRVRYTASTSS